MIPKTFVYQIKDVVLFTAFQTRQSDIWNKREHSWN